MRVSWLIGAACATGALAKPLDKRVYVTDWTIITVTETITLAPQAAPTAFVPKVDPIPVPVPVPEPVESDPEPVESDPPVVDTVVVTTAAPAPVSTSTAGFVEELSDIFTNWTPTSTSSEASQVVEATTLATAAPTTAVADPSDGYQGTILYNHNIHRSNHSVSSLTWNATLAANAQTLAEQCVYQHDTSIGGGGYGQNIGYGVSSDEIGIMITNLMYNDEFGYYDGLYGQASPDMTYFEKWGHFSQILWKGTVSVGCATITCSSLGNVDSSVPSPFTVCNYYPPGNYAGEYAENVLSPLGHAFYAA